jgi:hypothetical protein
MSANNTFGFNGFNGCNGQESEWDTFALARG